MIDEWAQIESIFDCKYPCPFGNTAGRVTIQQLLVCDINL